ncbi:MAG: hypothetical protein H7Y06_04370 [Opitutaceae bacterium]|nr:hypothetical protein [Opitutaceae bacterium]
MSESSSPPAQSFWRSVAQAIRGEQNDYTALPLNRAVLLLAVPVSFTVLTLWSATLFLRGTWKQRKL